MDSGFLLDEAALASDAPSAEAAPNAEACKILRLLTPDTTFSLSGSKLFMRKTGPDELTASLAVAKFVENHLKDQFTISISEMLVGFQRKFLQAADDRWTVFRK
ncbi:hypothetical protein [Pseudomonas syringae]|uniref:hypothetical protein n=1 Tax=Pseudomonas syringae TaxID=317 RepID=UPI000A117267|nr:hypothetical protein [Pseudomonas syringae]